jgi:hypothetical protein
MIDGYENLLDWVMEQPHEAVSMIQALRNCLQDASVALTSAGNVIGHAACTLKESNWNLVSKEMIFSYSQSLKELTASLERLKAMGFE